MKYKEIKEELITQFLNNSVQGNWYWNEDETVNVDGYVIIKNRCSELPVKFNKVTGSFHCADLNLKTLKGCPYYVGLDFSCRKNLLSSLEFSPKYVGRDFSCTNNLTIFSIDDVKKNVEVKGVIHT